MPYYYCSEKTDSCLYRLVLLHFKQAGCGPADFEEKSRLLNGLRRILEAECTGTDIEITITIVIVLDFGRDDLDRYLENPNKLLDL